MKTDPKNQKRVQGSRLHPELASPNNNTTKLYEARFFYTQQSVATEIIKATSLEEAQRKADEMGAEDISDFDPIAGELSVESVELIEEDKRHD
jgi:hypothetical protein